MPARAVYAGLYDVTVDEQDGCESAASVTCELCCWLLRWNRYATGTIWTEAQIFCTQVIQWSYQRPRLLINIISDFAIFSSRTQSHQTSQGGVLDKIVFLINGTETTVHNPDPKMSLNEWIRGQPGLKGWSAICDTILDRYRFQIYFPLFNSVL